MRWVVFPVHLFSQDNREEWIKFQLTFHLSSVPPFWSIFFRWRICMAGTNDGSSLEPLILNKRRAASGVRLIVSLVYFLSVWMNQWRQQTWEYLLILIQTMTWHMTWHLIWYARSPGAPMVRLEIKQQQTTWSKENELTDCFVASLFSLVWIFQRQVFLWHCFGASDATSWFFLWFCCKKSNFS